ncbi:heme-binding protein [Cryobacterium melibiosiphilum]|uniref:Heme-binding protein n=1 Tax=Cryobacterium melibiosiphilum TaxID=995039 RepID=A0A3A5MR76_9MICO|nr:heme-binding protein [Cryobacterium melibiosiphilum]RJT87914.1 heme-binding protein [Cryobacterium melibiosiphilum]
MTEQQPYRVVREFDDFELREYPAHLLAEVVTDGPFTDAGNRAFRPLFAYISGQNQSSQKVAMTAPVVQADVAGGSEKIAMTAPVVQQAVQNAADAASAERYRVAFVLPEGMTIDTAPRPTGPEVTLRTVPASTVGAIRFSGRWTETSFQEHLDRLAAAVGAAGFTIVGPPRYARFDPPFKPWFLRRNEVLLDVEPAD